MTLQGGTGPVSSNETRLRQERDLYWQLLNLGNEETLDSFLQESLNLVTELSGAKQGYIELRGQGSLDGHRWRIWHGLSEAELSNIENRISTGIMAEALSSGKTVVTPAAFMDPRFKERGSVRMGNIGAVLCAPIGGNSRLGVLYLHAEAGDKGQAFSPHDRERIELFAKHAAPFAERLIEQKVYSSANDATSKYRDLLEADNFIGKSPATAAVLKQISLVAPLDVSVLLTGPTGSGKTVVAKLIHDNGNRRRGPFVELNCANLSAELIENELFGAVSGAHSTAHRPIAGKIEAADGGTLFLDEIAELSLDSQAKLLQLLQTKHYFPLGSNQPVPADIRLISATNVSLEQAMKEGRFREDLFYRLQVLPIELPPLSQRKEDLALLATAFVERACEQHSIKPMELSRSALTAIVLAEWPGNVRQLSHAIEAATIRAAGEQASAVYKHHIFPGPETREVHAPTWNDATRDFQRQFLESVLEEYDWNVSDVAERLDLAKSHVYSLINSLDVKPNQKSVDEPTPV